MTEAQKQIIQKLDQILAAAGGGGGAASFASLTGSPSDNAALTAAIDAKVESEAYGPDWNGDTTHAPSKNDVYDKIEAVVASIPAAPYLVYTALLSQTSTDAPVATVLQNTLGGTVVWTYIAAGDYVGALGLAFTSNKTVCIISGVGINANDARTASLTRASDNEVVLKTLRNGVGNVDDVLVETTVEIRVYP